MIRDATLDDVDAMAHLAAQRRAEYERAQPQFWREAPDALERHVSFLASQVADADVVALVAVGSEPGVSAQSDAPAARAHAVDGFLIATLRPAPPVYDPGGVTGLVDDFAVTTAALWGTAGRDLLAETRRRLAGRGAVQLVVVCGDHDDAKLALLRDEGLATVSQWLLASLSPHHDGEGDGRTAVPTTTR